MFNASESILGVVPGMGKSVIRNHIMPSYSTATSASSPQEGALSTPRRSTRASVEDTTFGASPTGRRDTGLPLRPAVTEMGPLKRSSPAETIFSGRPEGPKWMSLRTTETTLPSVLIGSHSGITLSESPALVPHHGGFVLVKGCSPFALTRPSPSLNSAVTR